jgi:hypothetical protein
MAIAAYRSDVIVVGGGIAGISAALELLEAGLAVTMLDRDAEQSFGGLARESFGGIFVVGSPEQKRGGIRDSAELALADWHSFAQFGPDEHWPRRWAEAYVHRCLEDVYRWLRARGVGFFPVVHWVERGQSVSGNSVPRFHMVWGTGRELALKLIARLEAHPNRRRLQIRFGHRVDALMTANGAVNGCSGVIEAGGEAFEAQAGCVIVASGGINGSLEQVRRHWHSDWGSPPETILNGSHRYADGRLHQAVSLAGGKVTNMDRMWNYAAGVHHPRPRKPAHGLSLIPPRSALWMNWRGERIGPAPLVTGFDTRQLVTQICREQRQYSWQILNRKIALKELAVSGAEFNPSIRDKKRLAFLRDVLFGNRWLYDELTRDFDDVVVAGSLPELAEKMNRLQGDESVQLELLERDIRSYDDKIARGAIGEDAQLARIIELRSYRSDKVRTCNLQPILDPKAGPLMAIREFIISRKSLGGIQTDLHARVLDEAGKAIAGLYAAGEAAGFGGGGMHGLRSLEGTFLGGCILSGRIAGRAIAGRAGP